MNRGIGGQDHRKGEAMTAADVCDLSDAGKVVVFEQRGAQSAGAGCPAESSVSFLK
jgi:hypothetical protein